LSSGFTGVMQAFQQAREAGEAQHLYLQTVVQHVGVGLISFRPDGAVELINNTAQRLLQVNQLRNIKALEPLNPGLVETLFALKSGEQTLVAIEKPHQVLQLAISGTKFKLQGHSYTLASLQNIQNELERERMVNELEIARQVQMKLLPKSSPKLPGFDISGTCISAREIGGDYYDFFMLDEDHLGIAIGDVSGKGVPAAIYMTLTKGVVQSQAEENSSPREVLMKVNNFMYKTIETSSFITMIYAVLDLKTRQLTYARAGHNPVVYHPVTNESYQLLEPEGMALGLEKGKLFDLVIEEQQVQLTAGDLLVFYTDGFSEAMNKNQQEYGEARLYQVIGKNKQIPAQELIQTICRDVNQFIQEQPQHDDMTMVVLKVNN